MPTLYTGSSAFASLTANTPATSTLNPTSVLNSKSLFIQGTNITAGSTNVAGISALYPSQGTTYWTINMTVVGAATGSATYTVSYYGLS